VRHSLLFAYGQLSFTFCLLIYIVALFSIFGPNKSFSAVGSVPKVSLAIFRIIKVDSIIQRVRALQAHSVIC